MSLEAFVSSSFGSDDKKVVDKIIAILSDLDIECFQAKNVPFIPGSIIESILRHRLYVAILTPKTSGEVSASVSFEVGVARSHGKQVIILREDVLPLQSFYADYHQKPFNRDRILRDDPAEVAEMRSAVIEICRFYGYELGEPDMELQRRYEFARVQAQHLGTTILGYFNETLYRNKVKDKAVKNFPTEADRHANSLIENAIRNDFTTRSDSIVSEESSRDRESVKRVIREADFVWIVDPLDGTMNFAYGFPFFCISLGLLRNQSPVLGVIYNPQTQELYCGRAGYGSECFDLRTGTRRRLHLSKAKSDLEDCVVMTHLSSDRDARTQTISILDDLMVKCRAVRMLGSGQMALVSLALGQFDVFFNYQTYIWDVVPGYVILRGAGGYITNSLQKPDAWDWRSRGVLAASNQLIGEQCRKFLGAKFPDDFPVY